MSITTLDIDGVSYPSYGTLAEALAQLRVDPIRWPAWNAAEEEARAIALIASTATFDSLSWAGVPRSESQRPQAWPRQRVAYPDGAPVLVDLPDAVQRGAIILAGSGVTTPASLQPSPIGAQSSKRVKAGAVEIEYFAPVGRQAVADPEAQRLIAPFLAAAQAERGYVSGASDESAFDEPRDPKPSYYP